MEKAFHPEVVGQGIGNTIGFKLHLDIPLMLFKILNVSIESLFCMNGPVDITEWKLMVQLMQFINLLSSLCF